MNKRMTKRENRWHNRINISDLCILIVIFYFTIVEAIETIANEAKKVNLTDQINANDVIRRVKPIEPGFDKKNIILSSEPQIGQSMKSKIATHGLIDKLENIKKIKLRRQLDRAQEPDVDEHSILTFEPTKSVDQHNHQSIDISSSPSDSDYPQESATIIEEFSSIDASNPISNDTVDSLVSQDADNNDVEKLVRTQLDLAATNWATFAPNEYLPHLNTDNQGSASRDLNSVERQHPLSNHRMDNDPSGSGFYPNHNYKFDSNTSSPFWQHNPRLNYVTKSQDSAQEFSSTNDPLTTLSDGSNKYGSMREPTESYKNFEKGATPMVDLSRSTQNHTKQFSYLYRLRGPITASTLPHYELAIRSTSTPRPSASTRSHSTLSPTIMRTYERLDGIRHSTRGRFDSVPSSRVDLTKVIHKALMANSESSNNGTSVHNLFSNLPDGSATENLESFGGKISSKGFIDSPVSSGWDGDHQNVIGKANDARLYEHGFNNLIQTTHNLGKVSAEEKLPALAIEYHRRPSASSEAQAILSDRANSALRARAYKMGHTSVGISANQRSTLPSPVTENLNGSLAARLNANRYKNRQSTSMSPTTIPVSTTSGLFYTPAEPLTINLKKIQDPLTRKLMLSSTNLPSSDIIRPMATSTTPSLQMELPIQRSNILIRTDLPVKTTTVRLPSSTYATTAPNLAPALYAAALNNAGINKPNNSSLAASSTNFSARPAHHHHLHSHVHSIKPAVISIPIPIQPKFGAYESVLTAAAAAAAAAASASATRTRSGRRPFIVRPMPPVVPRLQAIKPVVRKIPSMPIPIGGTLASTRATIPKMVPDQNTLPTFQYPSVLANLLESANKALKQVTGNSLLSLQTNNNLIEPIMSKKAALVYPNPYTKQGEGPMDLLNFPMYSANLEAEPFENPMESIGLYQAPISLNSDSSPVYSYLENLLSVIPPDDYLSNQTAQYEAVLPILSETTKQTQYLVQQHPHNIIDWDSNATVNPSNDADNVMFASLGGDSNILYPFMHPDRLNNVATGSRFSMSGSSLSDQSSNMMNNLDKPMWNKRRPQMQPIDKPSSGRLYKTIPKGSSIKEQSTKTKGKRPYSFSKHLPDSSSNNQFNEPMQYALTHYVQDQYAQNQDDQHNGLIYDVFDDKDNKFSFPEGVEYFATPETMDGFRPIRQPSYHYSLSNNSSNYFDVLQNVGIKTKVPNMINSDHQPVVQAHDLVSQEKDKKANGQKNSEQVLSTNQPGLRELYHHSNVEPTHLIQILPHNIYTGHAMTSSGSSLKPHIIAVSDLINHHKQHLIDHHYLHHLYRPNLANHQDMATSESARLAVSSPVRGSLLAHFWPIALAMIPIMIVVAILAQLVMTAPLVMFAMTTLTVSRLAGAMFGPLANNREDLTNSNSILFSPSLLNNTSTNLRAPRDKTEDDIAENTGNKRKKKRKRDLGGLFEVLPHYRSQNRSIQLVDDRLRSLKLKLENTTQY